VNVVAQSHHDARFDHTAVADEVRYLTVAANVQRIRKRSRAVTRPMNFGRSSKLGVCSPRRILEGGWLVIDWSWRANDGARHHRAIKRGRVDKGLDDPRPGADGQTRD